jgi:hypothetical protein
MFQLFLRARAHKLRKRAASGDFRARSADRDAEADHARVNSVILTIESALASAEAEQVGLGRRVEDVLARASVTFGNGADEYLTREPLDSHHHNLFDTEISSGQRRLQELAATVTHLKFLKAATLIRFSDFKRSGGPRPIQRDQP